MTTRSSSRRANARDGLYLSIIGILLVVLFGVLAVDTSAQSEQVQPCAFDAGGVSVIVDGELYACTVADLDVVNPIFGTATVGALLDGTPALTQVAIEELDTPTVIPLWTIEPTATRTPSPSPTATAPPTSTPRFLPSPTAEFSEATPTFAAGALDRGEVLVQPAFRAGLRVRECPDLNCPIAGYLSWYERGYRLDDGILPCGAADGYVWIAINDARIQGWAAWYELRTGEFLAAVDSEKVAQVCGLPSSD